MRRALGLHTGSRVSFVTNGSGGSALWPLEGSISVLGFMIGLDTNVIIRYLARLADARELRMDHPDVVTSALAARMDDMQLLEAE